MKTTANGISADKERANPKKYDYEETDYVFRIYNLRNMNCWKNYL